ncbi:MAG: hypothetical protein MJ175_11405, partial [Clostridia bacterium]|nr:hypothetical protein [Clostridia bacterium]
GTLRNACAFYRAGGIVIATTCRPTHTVETGEEAELRTCLSELFGEADTNGIYPVNTNGNGGIARFLASADSRILKAALDALPVTWDVLLEPDNEPDDQSVISYIHKNKDGEDIWYFVNCSDRNTTIRVTLRSNHEDLETWNPHNGSCTALHTEKGPCDGTITFSQTIDAHRSCFVVPKS